MSDAKTRRKRCPQCQVIKPMRRRQVCCSHACAAAYMAYRRGAEWRKERSKKAAAAWTPIRRQRQIAKWQALIEAKGAVMACRMAYASGYSAGRMARPNYELSDAMKASWKQRHEPAA